MSDPVGLENNDVPVRRTEVEWVELDGEAVLYDPEEQILHRLNEGAAAVWMACDGTSAVEQIVAFVQGSYPDHAREIERDVRLAIEEFAVLGLLRRADG